MAEKYFKDPDYLNNLNNYQRCINKVFANLKDNHKDFDLFIKNVNNSQVCANEYKVIKDKIDGGILDYENFAK